MSSMRQSDRPGTGRHEGASRGGDRPSEGGPRGDRSGGGSSPEAPGRLPHHVPGEPPEQPGHHRVVVVVVDGSPESGAALRQAASQARQRNALLDIVCIVPDGTAGPAAILARVRLGQFTRRECPQGIGVPIRLRVECGDSTAGAGRGRSRSRAADQRASQTGRGGRRTADAGGNLSRTSAQAQNTRAHPRTAGLTGPRHGLGYLPRGHRRTVSSARQRPRRVRCHGWRRSCSAAMPPPACPPRSPPGRPARPR